MDKLRKLASNLGKIDIPKFINEQLATPEIQKEMIRLIQVRLYFEGKDSFGRKLRTDRSKQQGTPNYAKYTERVKNRDIPRRSRRRFDNRIANVTLNDFGDFYKSFRVKVKEKITEITANFRKKSGHIYDNFKTSYSGEEDFENAITDLNEREIDEISKILFPKVISRVNQLINV